jgi:hypothetical protein
MKKMSDEEKQKTTNELNMIIQEFETALTSNTKEQIEAIYNNNKSKLESLCAKYQEVNLPEIDALEFHSTYSEEYKTSRKEEYLDLAQVDRDLYKAYALASNYEYYILETIDKLNGEEVSEVGKESLEKLKALFNELDLKLI